MKNVVNPYKNKEGNLGGYYGRTKTKKNSKMLYMAKK
jgi:hypothetical protein